MCVLCVEGLPKQLSKQQYQGMFVAIHALILEHLHDKIFAGLCSLTTEEDHKIKCIEIAADLYVLECFFSFLFI